MAQSFSKSRAYGINNPLQGLAPAPINAQRAPTVNDRGINGQIWVDVVAKDNWVCCGTEDNETIWVTSSGGSGDFSSITVNPGDVDVLLGDINIPVGDINLTSGDVNINGGDINVGVDATISGILTVSTGASFNVLGSFAVQGASVDGGVGVDTVVLNANVGVANFVGFTTAAAAQQVLTITNSAISATNGLVLSVANGGADDAQMSISRIEKGAGTVDVTLTNNGGDALNVASIISITFQVIGV